MTKSTLLHLRIPFSFYLLPVFLFACSLSGKLPLVNLILVGIVLHLFLYPASNGYNSYFDKDEESIGGLKKPPTVSKELYWYSLLFDFLAIAIGVFINWQFTVMLLIYGLVSKAYSHPTIRLKKMPFAGWFVAGFFQGYFTFIMVCVGLGNISFQEITSLNIQLPALLSSMLLWGSYPMTQIYQHNEDRKRGDITISLRLGVLGTFHFTAVAFFIATMGFFYFYSQYYSVFHASLYMLFLSPVLLYFGYWYLRSRKNVNNVNYSNTMNLNFISALMMNLYFIGFYFFK
ncbi:UbiA family prenyltransferase [Reichenbachiella sp. MALMAid0571]|uniref:UbiA family prenyltransferase n=1 Tax=Reichenbachiella sp. MALMAid0571 TaxID=3143939 RepID=UPI0032E017EC